MQLQYAFFLAHTHRASWCDNAHRQKKRLKARVGSESARDRSLTHTHRDGSGGRRSTLKCILWSARQSMLWLAVRQRERAMGVYQETTVR